MPGQGARAGAPHHLLHLLELLQQLVDLLGGGAAPPGDADPARAVDDDGSARSFGRHRTDDGLDPRHLGVVDLVGGLAELLGHARHEAQDPAERAHLLHLVQLLQEVVEGEAARQQPVRRARHDVLVHRALGLLDQREHVAHAEDPVGHAVRVEQVEVAELLPGRREDDRAAHHLLHLERGAATRVAVELGEDHAVEGERLVEGPRGGHGVLAGHGVDDEERVVGIGRAARSGAPRP